MISRGFVTTALLVTLMLSVFSAVLVVNRNRLMDYRLLGARRGRRSALWISRLSGLRLCAVKWRLIPLAVGLAPL